MSKADQTFDAELNWLIVIGNDARNVFEQTFCIWVNDNIGTVNVCIGVYNNLKMLQLRSGLWPSVIHCYSL